MPVPSVTTTCSPCIVGEVAVTTTSATGWCVAASVMVPVSVAEPPWASAMEPRVSAAERTTPLNARTKLRSTCRFTVPLLQRWVLEDSKKPEPNNHLAVHLSIADCPATRAWTDGKDCATRSQLDVRRGPHHRLGDAKTDGDRSDPLRRSPRGDPRRGALALHPSAGGDQEGRGGHLLRRAAAAPAAAPRRREQAQADPRREEEDAEEAGSDHPAEGDSEGGAAQGRPQAGGGRARGQRRAGWSGGRRRGRRGRRRGRRSDWWNAGRTARRPTRLDVAVRRRNDPPRAAQRSARSGHPRD